MERYPGWSAAGGAVMGVSGGTAAAIWLAVADRSWWELLLAALFSLLAVVGAYWMVAALKGWWPFKRWARTQEPIFPERIGILNEGEADVEGSDFGPGLARGILNRGRLRDRKNRYR